MKKKAKFKPVITRVRLNPEQAVLACECYSEFFRQRNYTGTGMSLTGTLNPTLCQAATKNLYRMVVSAGGTYSQNAAAAVS